MLKDSVELSADCMAITSRLKRGFRMVVHKVIFTIHTIEPIEGFEKK